MTTMTLAEALRVTAKRIEESPDDYKWSNSEQCNCGHLFRTIAGIDRGGLRKIFMREPEYFYGVWSWLAGSKFATCPIAMVPADTLIGVLRNFGISINQIVELEKLSNVSIRNRAGLPKAIFYSDGATIDHADPSAVVRYTNAWANMLDESVNADIDAASPISEAQPV